MDSQPKQRSQQSAELINELEREFANIVRDSPSTIMLGNKMTNFVKAVEERTVSKCANEISEIEKYATLEVVDGENVLKRKEGQEAEADRAINNLQQCQGQFTNFMMALNLFSQYNLTLLSKSTDHCLDDCENKNFIDQSDLKNCFRNCYESTYKYTLRSAESLLGLQIDSALEELKKI